MKLTQLIFAPLLALSPVAVAAQDESGAATSESESADLTIALERGATIYNYDQAAWHTTDAMLEDVPDPAAAGIRGWVVTEAEDGLRVTYWKPEDDAYRGVYSATFDGGEVTRRVTHSEDDSVLSEEQSALIAASQVPNFEGMGRCGSQPWNMVVMPSGSANGSTFVYLLTPQTAEGYPLGGHYRYEVLDGEVLNLRSFSRTCDLLLAKNAETGERVDGHMVTHILDPIPTELHAFTVLSSRIPLFVGTLSPPRMWALGVKNNQPAARLVE